MIEIRNRNNLDQYQNEASSDVIISARNISKMYMLFDRPVDRLKQSTFGRFGRTYGRAFWALNNVSFDIRQGDAVGILGQNGSGKSTLLQIVAGVLQPTEGVLNINGRISALLELGSGFNPDYTGRENIYLSGAILGFNHHEMEEKSDEIISFADIGDFIDQPVKTYSSGMFARLAFSVAIAVDPDILIVDEILSVGDYGFQQKCVARMRRMRENGLTLLFVSHSVDAIKSTCQYGLFLNHGKTMYWGDAEQAANLYLGLVREEANKEALQNNVVLPPKSETESTSPGRLRYGSGHVQITRVWVENSKGEDCQAFDYDDQISIVVEFRSIIDAENLSMSILVRDNAGIDLVGTTSFDEEVILPSLKTGQTGTVKFSFHNVFRPGNYGISIAINRVSQPDYSDNILFDQIDSCCYFISMKNLDRPIHYKLSIPISIEVVDRPDVDTNESTYHE